MNIDSFRKDPSKYFVNLIGSSLRSKNSFEVPTKTNRVYGRREQELFGLWGVDDCECIGFYHFDVKTKSYIVDDLRKINFDKIYYLGDKEQCAISLAYPYRDSKITPEAYYLFTWKLTYRNASNPYEIELEPSIQPRIIEPKWFIDILFDDRHNDKSRNFGSAKNFLDTLSKQLSAKESTFVYELLQNANDYPQKGVPVDVEFHITDKYLLFMHSGDFFNVRNISGICGINEKEKSANKKTIGYKGIGFKTVFLNNHYVYIQTGDYSFRFDEGETPEKRIGKKMGKIKRQGAPFPILPIWTSKEEVPNEVASVFNAADEKFRVKIALRPDDTSILHTGRKNYENLFKDIFEDSNLILFIPNIRSVKVFIQSQLVRDCFIDENKWLISNYEEDINEGLRILVNKDIDTEKSRIPEKYKDFDRTKVSFACRKDGRKLLPIENAHLYCYLPTSASWGFPFLLNTDMIPKGDRDDIEREVYLKDGETNFNFELSRIAGEKFFCWIQDLVKSGKYDYDSIFSLIPNFEKCKKETDEKYAEFIDNFKEGFENKLQDTDIIPVLIDRAINFKPVPEIIYDKTGLSCSGIMTDDQMLSMSKWKDYFPHPLLRNYGKIALSPGIKSFLDLYHDDSLVYDKDTLHEAVENTPFQKWLESPDNNEKFLGFLLNKGIIDYFSDSPIFLSENGKLYKPEDLYYNIDDYYEDISSLDSYLSRLSLRTRKFCENKKDWIELKNKFRSFAPKDFVDNVLLDSTNKDKVQDLLSQPEVSVHFMHFLSQHVGFSKSYKKFPFVDSEGNIVDNFIDPAVIFTPSKDAELLRREKWINSKWIAIISSAYDEDSQKYLLDNFGVQQYEDEIVIKNI